MKYSRFVVDEQTINSEEWDQFVVLNGGHFMQSASWGKFKAANGWKTVFLSMRHNGEKIGCALVLGKKLPIIGRYIYYLPRGPVSKGNEAAYDRMLLDEAIAYAKKQKGIFLRIDPYLPQDESHDNFFQALKFRKLPYKWSSWNCPRYVLWLNLTQGEENVFNGVEKKTRNIIKIPYKKGVQFRQGDQNDLDSFYRLMNATAERKQIGVRDRDYYEQMYATLSKRNMVQIFCADLDNAVIASAMSIVFGKIAWLLYAASDRNYSNLNPHRALQWEMIKWALEKNCKRYDFRGTATDDPPKPSDPGYGVYRFKKSFNSEYISMCGYYDYIVSHPFYRVFILAEKHLFPILPQILGHLKKVLPEKFVRGLLKV